jgi:butyrate kinase
MSYKILVINPGATSTKVALYEDNSPIFREVIKHSGEQLSRSDTYLAQHSLRREVILKLLAQKGVQVKDLDVVVGRGGPFKPLGSGTYRVNDVMLEDIRKGRVQAEHISNIGALLADEIARPHGLPAFVVDPVSVDEFDPVARISGLPELERKCLSHALNLKMVAKKYSRSIGKPYDELNLIVVHLGGGISVTAHLRGRMVDVNNANDGGPFSPQRTGSLPVTGLAKLCYKGGYSFSEMISKLIKRGGLLAYLGTDNLEEVTRRIEDGDSKARLILEAMAYQIAKEIGAMATVLKGRVDAIIITGGMAYSQLLLGWIKERIAFISKVVIYPGEDEMEALALGALGVLRGEEEAKKYR